MDESEIYFIEELSDYNGLFSTSLSSYSGYETGKLKLRRLLGVKEPIVVLLAGESDFSVGGGLKPPDGINTRVVLLRRSLLFYASLRLPYPGL